MNRPTVREVLEDREILIDHILSTVLREAAPLLHAEQANRLEKISDRWRTNNLIGMHDFEWVERLYEEYC